MAEKRKNLRCFVFGTVKNLKNLKNKKYPPDAKSGGDGNATPINGRCRLAFLI